MCPVGLRGPETHWVFGHEVAIKYLSVWSEGRGGGGGVAFCTSVFPRIIAGGIIQ